MIVIQAEISPEQDVLITEALGAIAFYNVVIQSQPGAEPELTCYCADDAQHLTVSRTLSALGIKSTSTRTSREALAAGVAHTSPASTNVSGASSASNAIALCDNVWLANEHTDLSSIPNKPTTDCHVIRLKTQFAFGDGDHASTRLAAQCLQPLTCDGKTVIDLGCGTGVLGLMAHAMGASQLYCSDVDQDSVLATREACTLNNVTHAEVLQSDLLEALPDAWQGDIVIGNLYAPLLIEMLQSPKWPSLLGAPCDVIFSGIHADKRDGVVAAIVQHGYAIQDCRQENEWHALRFHVV